MSLWRCRSSLIFGIYSTDVHNSLFNLRSFFLQCTLEPQVPSPVTAFSLSHFVLQDCDSFLIVITGLPCSFHCSCTSLKGNSDDYFQNLGGINIRLYQYRLSAFYLLFFSIKSLKIVLQLGGSSLGFC